MTERAKHRWQWAARWTTAAIFAIAGVKHFSNAEFFTRIVPRSLPHPRALVFVSGACEIAGGLGILIKPLRRPVAWGLLALLIAVFPANVYMAQHPEATPEIHAPAWVFWARLPLQVPLMALVWFAGLKEPRSK